MELELADAQKQMQEQESEAVGAIAKWEQNVFDLEEKCSVLEEKIKLVSDDKVTLETKNDVTIIELREALKIAQDTLAKDEEVVQQWEGKQYQSPILLIVFEHICLISPTNPIFS